VSLALYRKYRPGSFAELVGQDHVSAPLMQALRSGRTHHAYLFSGPRGCGKTSSARILARSLNCEKGPTDTPCGVCDSCVALAPGGPGSLDVIEIDAASHNGVDDARDLRERAFFAPVSSRFKIYIIDEAHMVTSQAFNALLKVVEEPPPHVCFIFATTEPDRVLPTIKSRTFHYRFRLLPPGALREHLASICQAEGIEVDPLVLPLVVRAGAGSARDALSVLDQLISGSAGTITYDEAVAALGFTDTALLDEVVDAFAAGDGAAVFGSIDRVIEAGLDPRRFAQDLLERLRDLLVLDAVPDAGETGLLDCPADVLDRMRGQTARFGRPGMSRAADVMAQALVDMRGTTSPRLVLELACARILLPGAASVSGALLARLDRLERRLSVTGAPAAAPIAATHPSSGGDPQSTAAQPDRSAEAVVAAPAAASAQAPAPAPEPAPPLAQHQPGEFDAAALRRIWPDVLDVVKTRSRVARAVLEQYAQIGDVDAGSVTLLFHPASFARQFEDKADYLREALRETVGLDLKVLVKAGSAPGETAAAGSAASASAGASAAAGAPPATAPAAEPEPEPEYDDDPSVEITDQPAPTPEAAALDLLKSGLGAEVIETREQPG
jgi:DNA polymerase-3 subunit gamma/tau